MKRIICFGDSNTWGYCPENDGRYHPDERWPGRLKKRLAPEYQIINNGLCGRTTRYSHVLEPDGNGREAALRSTALSQSYDIAVIMLGTNDCKDIYDASPEEIAAGVEEIGRIFERAGAQVLLVVPVVMMNLTQSPFFDEFGTKAERKSKLLAQYYQRVAKSKGWFYLDASLVARVGRYDGIHLDCRNHKSLGDAIYNQIKIMEEQDERQRN